MNARAEMEDLRARLAESERQRQALEASLKSTQASLTEKVREWHFKSVCVWLTGVAGTRAAATEVILCCDRGGVQIGTHDVALRHSSNAASLPQKELETGRILTEHKSENEKLRRKLTLSEQRDLVSSGGVASTGQAITDAVYTMLAESEDDKSANILLKLKDVRASRCCILLT